MPVTLLCNHALVDGRHIAAFYHGMERISWFRYRALVRSRQTTRSSLRRLHASWP